MAGYCTKRSTVGQHGSGLVDPSQEEILQIALGWEWPDSHQE